MPTTTETARRRDPAPTQTTLPLGQPVQAAPFLKWAGGKGKLLDVLCRKLPTRAQWTGDYYEPFMGSAALFFRLKQMAAIRGKAFLGDTNPDLVGCFKAVQNEPQELLALLREHAIKFESDGKTHYDAVRKQHNLDGTQGAARFIFLNRACFNGLWRVNSKGHFNVPMGRYENPLAPAFSRIAPAAEALTGTSISLARFDSLVADAREGSFIYFDPPYDPLTKTASFTAYTADGFGDKEQEELRDLAIALAKRGCYVMLSNSSTPLTRELYGDTTHFHMHEVPVRRVISAVGSTRTVVNEIVVTTYAPPIS